jgi:hypothetical protein
MYLTFPIFLTLFILFGDTPVYFDRIYTLSLLVLSLFCINDKDILGCIFILLLFWLSSEAIFYFSSWIAKPFIYVIALCLCYSFFRHFAAKLLSLYVLTSLASEYYWLVTSYDCPDIYYYIGMISITTAVICILPKRLGIMAQWFNHLSGRNALDYQIITILNAYLVLEYLNLTEYFVRHLLGLKEVTFVYQWFPLISGLISVATLSVIFIFYFHNKAKTYLLA